MQYTEKVTIFYYGNFAFLKKEERIDQLQA